MTSMLERAKQRAQEEGLAVTPAAEPEAPAPTFDPDLIPDPGYTPSPQDTELDTYLDGVDILTAYRRWCGKMEPNVGSRRESVMISCPKPNHPDKRPSAWLNLDENVWFCGGCQEGGDKYDIAAYWFGYDVPGYKTTSFPNLRRDMGTDLGLTITRTIGGQEVVHVPKDDALPTGQGEPGSAEDEPLPDEPVAPVIKLALPSTSSEPETGWPSIDWRAIVPENTFLHEWMLVCAEDDLPEEFYFWLGLIALSLAVGDDVVLADSIPVKGNLFVCLFGPTGMGKSRSIRALEYVLRKALPYDYDEPRCTGAAMIPNPGSAEALIDSFSKPEHDPTDPTKVVGYEQVRALLKIGELSELIGRTRRTGSTLKPTLMELYDAPPNIVLRSRGAGTVTAERPYCSTITSTQPGAVKDLLAHGDTESGFANRWVFAMGRPKKLVAIGREALDLDRTVRPLQRVRTWSSGRRRLNLDPDAVERFTDFFDAEIEPTKHDDEAALLARIDLLLKKIIVLFAANEGVVFPGVDLVERVLAIHGYMLDTYAVLKDRIGAGIFNDCMDDVMLIVQEWPTKHGGKQPSISEIDRYTPKRYSRDLLVKVVHHLVQLERITELASGAQAGRKTTRYAFAS